MLDFAQQVIEEVLCHINNTGVYLDDIGALSMNWEHHILLLDKIHLKIGSQWF